MSLHENDIKEVLEALNVCRVATKNLHTKHFSNGLPLAIAQALELELLSTAQNLKIIIEMADKVRISNAVQTLTLAGYEVRAPQ